MPPFSLVNQHRADGQRVIVMSSHSGVPLNPQPVHIRRALLSVSDKTGVVEFARALIAQDIALLSTGGTYQLLKQAGLAVTEVADYTGFPEMMDGRVKTLHPKVHGGILGRRGRDDAVMQEHGILPIDLVVVNLYPFAAAVAKPGCDLPLAIENIDIGGPTMVRAAAKNHNDVAIVVNTVDYAAVLAEMQAQLQAWAARAARIASTASEISDCIITSTFAHRLSTGTSVGENAVLVEPGDMEAAGNALASVLRDDSRRAHLARAALETGKDLTWDKRAEQLEAFIRGRLG